jgi:murein DD-endopeptidase MepM/ murein hydrolase activator NlpD
VRGKEHFVLAFAIALVVTSVCPQTAPPVPGPEINGYAPSGSYAGHWGVDFEAELGKAVRAVADGVVTFSGSVVDHFSVTIDHGRGWVTSLSYLEVTLVDQGEHVHRGQIVGLSGRAHGLDAVHVSLRIDGTYRDPDLLFTCRQGSISDALHLVALPGS